MLCVPLPGNAMASLGTATRNRTNVGQSELVRALRHPCIMFLKQTMDVATKPGQQTDDVEHTASARMVTLERTVRT